MKRKLYAVLIAGLLAVPACKSQEEKAESAGANEKQEQSQKEEEKDPLAKARDNAKAFGVLPEAFTNKNNELTPEKIDLGRKLYYETRLSMGNDVSCNTCHGLDTFGVDNKAVSEGHEGQTGERNSPTVYNSGNQIAQFWDGRAATLEEQATGPVLNPVEMGMPDADFVAKRIKEIGGYKPLFEKAFPTEEDPINLVNIGKAIGAFERKLVTPAPFDKFIEGDDKALTEQQIRGLNTFAEVGCTSCHMGNQVGGTMFQKLGLIEEWPDKSDKGRYEVTEKESDMMMFKVPILRNVAKTAPYFHDGSVKTLEEAVRLMAKHQRGQELSDQQVDDIVAFLNSLTGKIPQDYIKKPTLPGMETAEQGG